MVHLWHQTPRGKSNAKLETLLLITIGWSNTMFISFFENKVNGRKPPREVDKCTNSITYINRFILDNYCQHLALDNLCSGRTGCWHLPKLDSLPGIKGDCIFKAFIFMELSPEITFKPIRIVRDVINFTFLWLPAWSWLNDKLGINIHRTCRAKWGVLHTVLKIIPTGCISLCVGLGDIVVHTLHD